MTPEQALQILDQAAASAPLTRREHLAVQEAVQVLSKLLESRKTNKPNDQD